MTHNNRIKKLIQWHTIDCRQIIYKKFEGLMPLELTVAPPLAPMGTMAF